MPSPADQILEKAHRQIGAFRDVRGRVRWASSLKRLTEEAAQEYEGRFLIELIQNAYDAHPPGRSDGYVHVLLAHAEGEFGTLYVANAGAPFTYENFDALSDIAQSNKVAGEGIGNKGLGFRSVLQVCEWPEVYSSEEATPTAGVFDGYCFGFATEAHLRQLVDDEDLRRSVAEEVSSYLLPVPITERPDELTALAASGMCTVVRLPLRSEKARSLAAEQLMEMLSSRAPVMLFLDRLQKISFEIRGGDAGSRIEVLTRQSRSVDLVDAPLDWRLAEVDLGPNGRFLTASRLVDPTKLKLALVESVATGIDPRWAAWDQEAWVTVATRIDPADDDWHMYTFLPMGVPAPMAAHVNGPFFTKLARGSFSPAVPLNTLLLEEVAALCAETASRLPGTELPYARRAVVDVLAWRAPDHERLVRAFADRGQVLADAPLAPALLGSGDQGYTTLRRARHWDNSRFVMMTAETLAAVCEAEILEPALGEERLARLAVFCATVTGEDVEPAPQMVADWAEQIARWLHRDPFDGERWGAFYDDLAVALAGRADVLAGRRILIDDRGLLRDCRIQAAAAGTRAGRTVFFWPVRGTEGEEDLDPSVDVSIPKELEEGGVSFTHRDLPWYQGPQRTQRPSRQFFEAGKLVQRYQTRELLDYVTTLLTRPQSAAFYRAALEFVFRLGERTSAAQRLDRLNLRVPTAEGWVPAKRALFSREWPGTHGTKLDRLTRLAGASSDAIAEFRGRFLAPSPSWLPEGADLEAWTSFLRRIGVRDGLWPEPVGPERVEYDGDRFRPEVIARELELSQAELSLWADSVPNRRGFAEHPWTKYATFGRFWRLPGQGDYHGFTEAARELYAQLIVENVGAWGDEHFEVGIRRAKYPSDRMTMWPTPLRAFLSAEGWIPIRRGEGQTRRFVRPGAAWRFDYSTEGPPTFAPLVLRPFAVALERDTLALDRLAALGLRTWNDAEQAAHLVAYLGQLLATSAVAPTQPGLRKAYEQAWADVVRRRLGNPMGAEGGCLVVDRNDGLEAVPADGPDRVYVDDGASPLAVQALAEIGGARLCARPGDGASIVDLLKPSLGDQVVGISEIDIAVRVDGAPLNAELGELLIRTGNDWLVPFVASVVEFRSGPFRRATDSEVREAAERLRRVRIVWASNISVEVGGRTAEPSLAHRGVFPISDPAHPAMVVTIPLAELNWDLLERVSGALAELVFAAPGLGPVLFQGFVQLRRLTGAGDDLIEPTTDDMADALGLRPDQVREVHALLRSGLEQIIWRLELAVCHHVNAEAAMRFGDLAHGAGTDEDLAQFLEGLGVPDGPGIIVAAREALSLADLRERLAIPYGEFNAALVALDRPPLRDEAAHEQAFQVYLTRNHERILGSLRLRFLDDYANFRTLGPYVALRGLPGLGPDAAWLDICPVPSEEMIAARVDQWLAGHQAPSLSSYSAQLEPVAELRQKNLRMIRRDEVWLGRVVRAWSRKHTKEVPTLWRDATTTAVVDWADGAGILDFEPLTRTVLLQWLIGNGHWPEEIGLVVDLGVLGLTDADLEAAGSEADAERRQRERLRNSIELDGALLSALPTDLAVLAEAVERTITPEILGTRLAQASLEPLPRPPGRPPAKRKGGAVNPEGALSDAQKVALGLIGEVVTYHWLRAKYPTGHVRWVSGYRQHVFGGTDGDDTLGYDFEVLTAGGREPFLFEVKAGGSATEFEMSDGEIDVARSRTSRDRYRILFVRNARNSQLRTIHVLPNPFRRQSAELYRLRGRGVRYEFRLSGS